MQAELAAPGARLDTDDKEGESEVVEKEKGKNEG